MGVKKCSCLNRPAKDVIVKSVENDVVVVIDYKKIQFTFFLLQQQACGIFITRDKSKKNGGSWMSTALSAMNFLFIN